MFKSHKLTYIKTSDYLQTRVRNPRAIMPNFALYCDWIIWNEQHIYIDFTKRAKTIYVRSEINALNFFINNIMDKINNDFVLITSSHDLPMPMGFHLKLQLDWKRIVNNQYLKAWFTENCDIAHDKIKAIPLGIPCPDLPSWVLGSNNDTVWTSDLFNMKVPVPHSQRKLKIFGCWYSRTNHISGTCSEENDERGQAYNELITQNNLFDWHPPGLSRMEFLKLMSSYQFVLCPHGGGLDPNPKCWEALLMKSIPIVKCNTMSESLEHLPIVIIDDWNEITLEKMKGWSEKYGNQLYDTNLKYLMSNSYFFNQILEYV